ncbi:hypothetical protein [Paenibacillus sp. 8b26]
MEAYAIYVFNTSQSEEAIALAKSLNEKLGLGAWFLCSDIYDAKEALQ